MFFNSKSTFAFTVFSIHQLSLIGMSDRGSLMVIMDVAFKSGLYEAQTLVYDICLPQNLLISADGHVMVYGKL